MHFLFTLIRKIINHIGCLSETFDAFFVKGLILLSAIDAIFPFFVIFSFIMVSNAIFLYAFYFWCQIIFFFLCVFQVYVAGFFLFVYICGPCDPLDSSSVQIFVTATQFIPFPQTWRNCLEIKSEERGKATFLWLAVLACWCDSLTPRTGAWGARGVNHGFPSLFNVCAFSMRSLSCV